MLKHTVKTLMMLTLVVGLALASTVVSANVQSTSQLVTADVPFDFIVGDQTLRSGKYTVIKATNDGKGLSIHSLDRKSSVTRLSNPAIDKSKKQNARLVFHRYGQQYFLAEIWTGDTYGHQVLKCKTERRLEKEQAMIASKSTVSYEIVEVVAQVR